MGEQVQCPNCGGYRVEGSVRSVNVETGKITRLSPANRVLNVINHGLLGLVSEDGKDSLFKGVRKERIFLTRVHNYRCVLCGYKWEWDEREPKPEATVRPDLIAKGVKKLEEEEEERRRRADI